MASITTKYRKDGLTDEQIAGKLTHLKKEDGTSYSVKDITELETWALAGLRDLHFPHQKFNFAIFHSYVVVCMSESMADNRLRETWDRLVLLLIAQPREGWEAEFHDITRREIERLAIPADGDGQNG